MADYVTGFSTDVNNQQFAAATDPDAIMQAVFYVRAVYNEWETKKQGRPIYDDKIYCKYGPSGSTLLVNDVPSTNHHEQRFHRQWAAFKAGQSPEAQREVGTPLDQWAFLTPSAVEELRGLKFYSVDQLAAASDEQLGVLGMGFMNMGPFTLRDRAKGYLNAARNSALPMQQAAEIAQLRKEQEEKDKKHAAEIAELRAMIMQGRNMTVKDAKKKREWTPQQKEAARQRMAVARAAKNG